MKTVSIYLDMDGVLTDFTKGAYEACEQFHHIDGMYSDMKHNEDQEQIRKQFIEDIKATPNFWLNLSWMQNGRKLFNYVSENFDNVFILTAPMSSDWDRCCAEKVKWCDYHLEGNPIKGVILEDDKYKYVGHNKTDVSILIDDRKKNIDLWAEHGGIGILHDAFFVDNTISKLRSYINK